MKTPDDFFKVVSVTLKSAKFKECKFPVYRGHSKGTYELLPTLHRQYYRTDFYKAGRTIWEFENNLYCDFRSLVGPRVNFKSSWETLFAMRHEGIPTRLLDWTENIGTALYFALCSDDVENPHIWILNPYLLNEEESTKDGGLFNPDEDLKPYSETFANHCNAPSKDLNKLPIAVYPNRTNDRIFAQRGIFTIHGENESRMESICERSIERINIPKVLIKPLRRYLKFFGINSYSVYPDFKGLSDYLKELYNY